MLGPFLVMLLTCWMGASTPAGAHDANLARWDLRAEDDHWSIHLRTSGHGLFHSAQAANPGVDGENLDAEAYRELLQAFFAKVVVLKVVDERLKLVSLEYQNGHEVSVELTYQAPKKGEAGRLTLDLHAFTERVNQHHLVFVHRDGQRQRLMLGPGSGYALVCPSAPGDSGPTQCEVASAESTPSPQNSPIPSPNPQSRVTP